MATTKIYFSRARNITGYRFLSSGSITLLLWGVQGIGVRGLVMSTARLDNEPATAQDPTKISTAPNPNLPYELLLNEADWPACNNALDMTGPTSAAMPLNVYAVLNAIGVCSVLGAEESTAAANPTDENPPLCVV